jgi:hypothetical protein
MVESFEMLFLIEETENRRRRLTTVGHRHIVLDRDGC